MILWQTSSLICTSLSFFTFRLLLSLTDSFCLESWRQIVICIHLHIKLRSCEVLLWSFFTFLLDKYNLVLFISVQNTIKITFQLCSFFWTNLIFILPAHSSCLGHIKHELFLSLKVFQRLPFLTLWVYLLHLQINTSIIFLCNSSHLEDLKIPVK